jgi:DNA-binding response OmpR family regulator
MTARTVQLLFLEDYVAYARVLRSTLDEVAKDAFSLHCVTHLSQALQCLNAAHYDSILLDLGVSDRNGLSTLSQVVAQSQGVPIIVLTGVDDEEIGEAAVRAGAEDYLVKTQTSGQRLWRVIRYAIERHRLQMEHDEAARLRVLYETAGAAAHEINQPLTTVVGYADLILEGLSENHFFRPELMKIREAGLTIQEIVKQMQNIKKYATKPYLAGIEIVDLKAASKTRLDEDEKS